MAQRILIVGAGPTGLTAAVELARRGILPDVVEKRAGPSPLSRAVGILPESLRILAPSGVAAALEAEAVPFREVVFHRGARPAARLSLALPDGRAGILGLPQDRTEHHLTAAFARLGGRILFDTPLTGLSEDAEGVTVTLNGAEARFDRVIGADGVGSAVRAALGVPFPGKDLPGEWSIADVDSAGWPEPDVFKGYLLPGGQVCIVAPMAPARFRVIASTPDALAALPVPMTVDRLRRADRFRISVRQVPRYTTARVHLAGDAAHCHSPVGGRGMNLGIADAADLARRLADDEMDGYEAARHAAGSQTIRLSEAGRRAVQSESGLVRGLVTGGLKLAGAVPALNRAVVRRITAI